MLLAVLVLLLFRCLYTCAACCLPLHVIRNSVLPVVSLTCMSLSGKGRVGQQAQSGPQSAICRHLHDVVKEQCALYAGHEAEWYSYNDDKVIKTDWDEVKEVPGSLWIYNRLEPRQQPLSFASHPDYTPSPPFLSQAPSPPEELQASSSSTGTHFFSNTASDSSPTASDTEDADTPTSPPPPGNPLKNAADVSAATVAAPVSMPVPPGPGVAVSEQPLPSSTPPSPHSRVKPTQPPLVTSVLSHQPPVYSNPLFRETASSAAVIHPPPPASSAFDRPKAFDQHPLCCTTFPTFHPVSPHFAAPDSPTKSGLPSMPSRSGLLPNTHQPASTTRPFAPQPAHAHQASMLGATAVHAAPVDAAPGYAAPQQTKANIGSHQTCACTNLHILGLLNCKSQQGDIAW